MSTTDDEIRYDAEQQEDATVSTSGQDGGGGGQDDNDLIRLRAERNDLYNKLARAQAEFQNARKRLESDKEQSVQFANSSLIKSLLPVIDNFERAIAQDPAKLDVASLIKGMQIVHDQWLSVLAQQSVAPIAPNPGDPFDPATMQALMQQPTDKYPENHVTQTHKKRHTINGRNLSPTQICVSTGQVPRPH